jgi:hypothetical protein
MKVAHKEAPKKPVVARPAPGKPKRKTVTAPPALVLRRPAPPPAPPPQPTRDEAAALKAFEMAHKEFSRGHFAEARSLFRTLVEKYPMVSEVTARARTYLAVAEARLRTELALPRDADSLYDRGVIELNRGEYVRRTSITVSRPLERASARLILRSSHWNGRSICNPASASERNAIRISIRCAVTPISNT